MLTDLSFLEIGQPWTPDDADTTARLELYQKNRLLFDSKAEQVYGRWVEVLRDNVEETHYVLSFPRRLSFLWADLVVGEPPEYTAGITGEATELGDVETLASEGAREQAKSLQRQTTQRLNLLVEENAFNATAHEGLVDISRYGETVFRLRVEDGAVKIEGQSPEYWFPVVSESNIRKILYHVLAWTFEREEGRATQKYLRVEIHEAGRIEHRLYRLNGDDRIEERVEGSEFILDWPGDVEETGLDVPLVFHAPGIRTSDRLHGLDDYTPIDSSMEYLMWLAAQRQVVIHKHSDPWMSGPPLETTTTASGRQIMPSGSRYIPRNDQQDVAPEYHTFDGKLDASFRQTEELWKDVYLESETSPTAFDHSETGSGESGTSRRLRLDATLRKAHRICRCYEPVVAKVLQAAGRLGGEDFGRITFEWHDGLVQDPREASEISQRDIESGITSKKSEMMRRYDMTEEQAEEEMARIEEEGQGQEPDPLAAAASRILGPRREVASTNGQRQEEGGQPNQRFGQA